MLFAWIQICQAIWKIFLRCHGGHTSREAFDICNNRTEDEFFGGAYSFFSQSGRCRKSWR